MNPMLTAAVLGLAIAAGPAPLRAAPGLPSANVAWQPAAVDADIDRAFGQARAERKPLLLYWGASWCPPCNQLKATLFNRQDFAALSRSFVAVHIDGDRPGAQKLARRFQVMGYPTMVLFDAGGSEITRLPGEAEAPQVMALLQQGLAGGRAVKAVLADALAGKALSADEWKSLAFYSWDTDEQTLVPKTAVAATLARLAAATGPAAAADTATRLWLKALAAAGNDPSAKPDAALQSQLPRVQRVLAEPALARLQADVLSNHAAEIVRTLHPDAGAPRAALARDFDAALQRLADDTTLSHGNRIDALYGRVQLARIDQPKGAAQVTLPEALLNDVRQHAQRSDRDITDGYERQAVITAAGAALGRAGLWAESDALLKANLARSHSAYYLMSQLGSNARKLGKTDEALRWYGQAWSTSVGPATRLQWGFGYLSALVDLAPADGQRIEATARQLFAEAATDNGAFEGRSARSLQQVGNKLVAWNADGRHAAALRRLQVQLDGVCAKVDAADGQRAACQAVLKMAPGSKTA